MRYYFLILMLLTACGSGTNMTDEHPKLLSWSHEFVMAPEEKDFLYWDDHENFVSKYFSVRYDEKRIINKTLIEVNCIDSIAGSIDVSNNTIFLKSDIIMTDDRLCTEFHLSSATLETGSIK